MSDNFAVAATTQAHAADTEFFVRRGMTRRVPSHVIPRTSLIRCIRDIALWTITSQCEPAISCDMGRRCCIVGGGGFEYLRSAYSNPENVRSRRIAAVYNMNSVRADDHSTIGSILFAVITPALFWKRANAFNLIVGGAGIGSSVGLLAHYGRSISGDPPPPIPGHEGAA
ncbi:hypothetical protein BXZ70DRAFT_280108 [Cristinia sonorae]|uniref:Uncharacterized protein n=1 Tax=Cristinia sonorae TaxID=1940300 RepID=A0A8K0UYY0_9AGAR|nr:hypothetical protein BXZ70DRAFT_280108 [Cristinia sonorae]